MRQDAEQLERTRDIMRSVFSKSLINMHSSVSPEIASSQGGSKAGEGGSS